MEQRMPHLLIEQYRLGELDDAEAVQRIESDPAALAERLEELERSDREIFSAYPSGWFADRVRERATAGGRRRSGVSRWGDLAGRRLLPALAVAAAAIAFVPILLTTLESEQGGATASLVHGERIKGLEPALRVYRSAATGGDIELLQPRTVVEEGTHLQLAYLAAGASEGVILSLDGNSVVTLHFPSSPASSAQLERGGETALPFSYVLDDAPEFERFYFLATTGTLDVAAVLERARRAAAAGASVEQAIRTYAESLPGSSWLQQFELEKRGE